MYDLKILPKKEYETNKDFVFRVLYSNIMTLKMPPGIVVKEKEIANILNVSRTPVREVMLLLQEQQLIDISPRSYSKVSLIDLSIVREGFFMRKSIETQIYQQLSGNISKKYFELLTENLEEQLDIIKNKSRDDIDLFFSLDDDFHRLLYSAARKNMIWKGVKSTSSHFDRVRYIDSMLVIDDRASLFKEHQELYHNLLLGGSHSLDYFDNFVNKHLGHFQSNFNNIYFDHNEYFTFNDVLD